jgi:hypothetical protein
MADDLRFSIEKKDAGPRRAYRAKVPGLKAVVPSKGGEYEVVDLSSTGMSLRDEEGALQEGELLECDLFLNRRIFLSEIKSRVMRVRKGVAGCNFESVDRHKEERLDKLILEVQKRLIALRKQARAKDKYAE